MKKLLTLLTLVLLGMGSAWALTGTEKATNTGTKDTPITGTSYTIGGAYIAGAGGATATGMANKGVKFRTGANNSTLEFTVNEGYTITDFKLYGVSNYALKSGASEPCIAVTKVEVDGTEVTSTGTNNFPAKGSSTAGSVLLSNIAATQKIVLTFDNTNSSGNQINGYYEITWSKPDAAEPEATSVSPTKANILVGKTLTLTGSFTGGTFEGEWVSDNTSVATVSSTGVVTGKAEGTANITYQWKNDQSKAAFKATAAITVYDLSFDKDALTAVKTYDFANWGATTLTPSSTKEGDIWNDANSKNNPVYRCTNEGLTSLAIQDTKWSINSNGLYLGDKGRCAAICDVKAGQYIEFNHNSNTSFFTKNDGEDDGARKIELVKENNHYVYYVVEDGMVGFEIVKKHYVTSIVIYEEKVNTATFENTGNWEAVYAYTFTKNSNGDVTAEQLGAWPGTQLTADSEGMFPVETKGATPQYIIFHNNAGTQTADLEFVNGGKYNANGRVIVLNDYTVNFKSNGGWSKAYAYTWTGEKHELGDWPGTEMTSTGEGEWTITFQAENTPANIIFNNGSNGTGNQTGDLTFEDGKTYEYNLNDYTVTFTTNASWENVYAYAWNGSGDTAVKLVGDYPGQKLNVAEGVYTFTYSSFGSAPEKILFNGGNNTDKTPDMDFTNGRAYKWNTNTDVLYALEASENKIPAGTTVEVKDANDILVATVTYGVGGGADFAAPVLRPNEEHAGFRNYTGGNGENGTATSGTVYTIKPVCAGVMTVAVWLNADKSFFIQEDGTSLAGFDGLRREYPSSATFTFSVKANSEYKVYCTGSKLGFYGFDLIPNVDVTVPATGFTTYVNSANALNFEGTGITPYVIKTNADATKVSLVAKTSVAAGEPVLLYADGGATKSVPVAATATADADNLLVAGTGAKVKYSDTDQNYILWTNGDGVTGFYRANSTDGNTVAVGKAYLHISSGSGARFFSLDLDGETTAINSVNVNVNENGCFDLQGRRVAQPTKGLYIVNGKKVVIK